jgi:hypothetical protein
MSAHFERQDNTPDEWFYAEPRLITHIDAGAVGAVTQLYREYLPAGGVILDLMSSWVSHLPPEVEYAKVVGLGMNAEELGLNPRLNSFVVQNLNRDPVLPFGDSSLDGGGCCVSVLREVGRVFKPNAPFVVTFSNRCFPSKAVRVWLETTDLEHLDLVAGWMEQAGNWGSIEKLNRSPRSGDPLYAVVGRKR